MSATSAHQSEEIATLIPARLERLPWGRFHVLVIAALGITWILDGLEVTLAGSVAPALKESPALRFSDSEVGLAGSAYLLGAVVGALFFGWLTDRLGRKKLFFITIVVYLIATSAANIPPSIRPSRSWSPRATAVNSISRSTEVSGLARRSALWSRSCCSIRRSSPRSGDGGSRS
jgi:MFS family permease